MATVYQLWDNALGNLIEDYNTEREALEYVVDEVEVYGPDAVGAWALLRDPGIGPVTMIAAGADLIRHATATALPPAETARYD